MESAINCYVVVDVRIVRGFFVGGGARGIECVKYCCKSCKRYLWMVRIVRRFYGVRN